MFRIELQQFDSGRIAERVGVVHLDEPAQPPPEIAAAILAAGRSDGYDLLSLTTPGPVALEGFAPRGVLTTLAGRLEDIDSRLREMPARTDLRTLRAADWPAVRELLRWAAPTRFSTDPRVSAEAAREHKLAILRAHAERCPDHALVALARDAAEIVGFQLSYLDADAAVFYEITIHPAHRGGFAAVGLLAENVRRLRSAGARRVSSRIYVDNVASTRLFERIGMRRSGREEHFYHAWL